ncbi:SEC-C domain-containing protein [Patescibacteria group bacterium]|nr:SEC-C domain-containing protein [Patescibacteria group bacterium]
MSGEIEQLRDEEKVKEFLLKIANQIYESREKQFGPEMTRQIEKLVLANTIDSLWINHLEDIDYLREGVGLRGYAAKDPLVEYKSEAFKLFEGLLRSIDSEVVHRIFKIQLMPQQQQQTTQPISATAGSAQTSTSSIGAASVDESAVPEIKKKIGRNDPCPCGSGLKYKKCGLIGAAEHRN